MRGPTGRHPPTEGFVPDHRLSTPTPVDPLKFNVGGGGTRGDSEGIFSGSRPSSCYSAGVNHRRSASAVVIKNRSNQTHAISAINSYLSERSFPISFKLKSLPTSKDINDTLKFVLTHLDYLPSNKMEDDLLMVLKYLNCPIKISKSALKSPGTDHVFPTVLAILHWLVQIALYNEHLVNSIQSQSISGDTLFYYTLNTYMDCLRGYDDENIMEKLQQEKSFLEEKIKVKLKDVKDLEAKLESIKSGPSLRESKEEELRMLEKDIKKFNELIQQLQTHVVSVEKLMEEKEKELGIKTEERIRMCEENEELKKKVEEQGMNMREAERLKRELQSVERDIEEAETERNKWEEKYWDLDAAMKTKLKELKALQIECNQTIQRLKLGNDFQYDLNAKGLRPVEVLGMDYKSTLKPALKSASDDVKTSSMENLESLISLQQSSRDINAKIDAKRNRIVVLQSRIEEVEIRINLIKKETQDYNSQCAMEAWKLVEKFKAESYKVDVVEKEARELVESSKVKLKETMMRNEEEVEICGDELLALIDSVSKCKEFMVSKISKMKNEVTETSVDVAQVHKGSLKTCL